MNHLKQDLSLFEQNRVSAAQYEMCPYNASRCENVLTTAKVGSLDFSLLLPEL